MRRHSAKREETDIAKGTRINEQIRAEQVRAIDEDGTQLGILPLEEAQNIAVAKNLDLVEVAPMSDPPVCRIMDYGKYKYRASKRNHEARKRQRHVVIKELKLRPKTEDHDFQFKVKRVKTFLAGGYKAKVSIIFRGREITHPDIGLNMLNRFLTEVGDVGQVEQAPRMEGRNMTMLLVPKN